jgi:hypothetical protein
MDGKLSSSMKVETGIPQGSPISPLLFLKKKIRAFRSVDPRSPDMRLDRRQQLVTEGEQLGLFFHQTRQMEVATKEVF